jgi:LPXTG-site transpeptidase (sortase) family protein
MDKMKQSKSTSRKSRGGFLIRSRRLTRVLLSICLIVAAFGLAWGATAWLNHSEPPQFLTETIQTKPTQIADAPPTPTETERCKPDANANKPYLVSIPAVGIENACIETTGKGKKAKNQLDDPVDEKNFGWYKNSALPTSNGQGIYTCHFGPTVPTAICNNLHRVKVGDKITVEVGSGKKFVYTVRKTSQILLEKVDMIDFQTVADGAKRGISIMTCAGQYDSRRDTRVERLMVWATM